MTPFDDPMSQSLAHPALEPVQDDTLGVTPTAT